MGGSWALREAREGGIGEFHSEFSSLVQKICVSALPDVWLLTTDCLVRFLS